MCECVLVTAPCQGGNESAEHVYAWISDYKLVPLPLPILLLSFIFIHSSILLFFLLVFGCYLLFFHSYTLYSTFLRRLSSAILYFFTVLNSTFPSYIWMLLFLLISSLIYIRILIDFSSLNFTLRLRLCLLREDRPVSGVCSGYRYASAIARQRERGLEVRKKNA